MEKSAAFEAGVADAMEKVAISPNLVRDVIRRGAHGPKRLRDTALNTVMMAHKKTPQGSEEIRKAIAEGKFDFDKADRILATRRAAYDEALRQGTKRSVESHSPRLAKYRMKKMQEMRARQFNVPPKPIPG